jgi:hypothetical protein
MKSEKNSKFEHILNLNKFEIQTNLKIFIFEKKTIKKTKNQKRNLKKLKRVQKL